MFDRTWHEDAKIFARGLFEQGYMSSADWTLYEQLCAELLHAPAERPPRILIYLEGAVPSYRSRVSVPHRLA